MAAAGLDGPHASPKKLRHGFGVAAVTTGIPLNLVQKWLGHVQLSTTTAIYADAVSAEEKDIASRMWAKPVRICKTQADGLWTVMSRVFTSSSTGADVYVFSDDHCPPHVHAKHRGDGWIARIRFSFVGKEVQLLSIAPLRNTPLQRTVNQLLDDIETELPACREIWWAIRQTACLTNQWVVVSAPGRVELLSKAAPSAQQIAKATYDPEEERLRVTFHDGTIQDVSTRQ